jgi:hypothetical protein
MEGAFYRYPGQKLKLIQQKHTAETMQQYLLERTMTEIEKDENFLIFTHTIGQQPLSQTFVTTWIERPHWCLLFSWLIHLTKKLKLIPKRVFHTPHCATDERGSEERSSELTSE